MHLMSPTHPIATGRVTHASRWVALALSLALTLFLTACSGGGGGSESPVPPGDGGGESCAEDAPRYASTWEGIQKQILEKHGCTEQICHGSAKAGGLELSSAVAYRNIFEVKSLGSPHRLIEPGDNDRSYLWLKLAAKTNPGSVDITGAPMPNNLPALSADELELMRRWIYAGAPETGTVIDTEKLLAACLPDPQPIAIKPLDPPAPGEGVQFRLAPWTVPAKGEAEICFATYYDISDQVPPEYRDPSGKMFRFYGFDLRQDPQSHHVILFYPQGNFQPGGIDVHDPAFGAWTCKGGAHAGETCEPTDLAFCGDEGLCTSEPQKTFGCVGFGPGGFITANQIGGAQQANAYNVFFPGVFSQVPMKGVIYWNSHAFNLTHSAATMQGRINYIFAKDQRFPSQPIFQVFDIFKANAAPYSTQTVCSQQPLPKGSRVFELTSHTHKRGKHFTAYLPDGTQIYESSIYNDPVRLRFDPPLEFDSDDPAQRSIKYCSYYENGVKPDGSPDPETVTRASRIPPQGFRCTPTACTAGRIGASCRGTGDSASCDSSPGAGDGECDACPITGGESTENEMFVLIGSYYVDPEAARGGAAGVAALDPATGAELDARGRSLFTGTAFPPALGCGVDPATAVHMQASGIALQGTGATAAPACHGGASQ